MIREPGTILLGAPVGSVVFAKQAIQERVRKVQEIMSRLPQSEYVILTLIHAGGAQSSSSI